VDDRGVIRRERVTFEDDPVTSTLVLDFEDVGRPRRVELPDSDDVVDMTEDVMAQLESESG
jgi:hypothetical protein